MAMAASVWSRFRYHPHLVAYLREQCPTAFPYAEEAGLLVRDDRGELRAHWDLQGRIIFPYIADGEVVDLRTRRTDEQAEAQHRLPSTASRPARRA